MNIGPYHLRPLHNSGDILRKEWPSFLACNIIHEFAKLMKSVSEKPLTMGPYE